MFIISTRHLLGAIAAFAIAVAISASLPGSAEAYQCKNSYKQGEGIHNLAHIARAAAKAAWTANAKNAYGLAWSVWDIAKSKSQNCSHTGGAFYCIYKAQPCLYVVP
jgi:hypothetical protein